MNQIIKNILTKNKFTAVLIKSLVDKLFKNLKNIMAENEAISNNNNTNNNHQIDIKKCVKIQEFPMGHITPSGITRERSFVRQSNQQQVNFIPFFS